MNNNNNIDLVIDATQPPNNISSVFKPELIISQAINLSEDFIPIDEIKLAEIANFTPKEISMLKLFWNPCFNSTWIYLSDEIILNFLTNSKTEDAVNNFIRKVLITNNEKEIDYLQVDKNHEIVKSHFEKFPKKRISHNKKFFIISSKTLYSLLLKRNTSIMKNEENIISDKLSKQLNGKREKCLNDGKRIDILTNDTIIEVKNYKTRLAAIGQILYYSKFYKKHYKRIHLFNHNNIRDEIYENLCKSLDILVTYE